MTSDLSIALFIDFLNTCLTLGKYIQNWDDLLFLNSLLRIIFNVEIQCVGVFLFCLYRDCVVFHIIHHMMECWPHLLSLNFFSRTIPKTSESKNETCIKEWYRICICITQWAKTRGKSVISMFFEKNSHSAGSSWAAALLDKISKKGLILAFEANSASSCQSGFFSAF